MAEDSGQNIVAALLDHILPLVPGLTVALQNGISVLTSAADVDARCISWRRISPQSLHGV